MTLEELRDKDYWGAFDDWITVKEAKETGLIPEDFHFLLQDNCTCGSERMIKKNRKSWTCVDPKCPIKLSKSMVEVFNRFGIKNIGDKSCLKIIEKFYDKDDDRFNSIFGIFENADIEEGDFGESLTDKYICALTKIRSQQLTFSELVSLIGLPQIKGKADDIVRGVKTFKDLLIIVKERSINYYYDMIGLENNTIKFYFNYFLLDMIMAHNFCRNNMITATDSIVDIVITGSITFDGEPITKDKYVKMLNELATVDGHRLFTIRNGKSVKSTNYFIWERKASSSSASTALAREKEENRQLIYTADEFALIVYNTVNNNYEDTEDEGREVE